MLVWRYGAMRGAARRVVTAVATATAAAAGPRRAYHMRSGHITAGYTDAVGNTPLLALESISKGTGCTILGKAEFMQPGGSVKDRAALFMIMDAERRGLLQPGRGQLVVEGTAGNTGIGLAHVCHARGYELVIFMPNTQSQEKVDMLEQLGCEVKQVPVAPWHSKDYFGNKAKAYAQEKGGFCTDQFDNTANRDGHTRSTGPELWAQTGGKLDAFVSAAGTGGTICGVSAFLKSVNPDARVVLADPPGSIFYDWVHTGEFGDRTGSSIAEGIGNGRVTPQFTGVAIDDCIRVDDRRALAMLYRLLDEEGLHLGISSALNVVAAVETAEAMGPGHTIATVLCDGAARYQSRLYNRAFLEERGLWELVPERYQRACK